MSTYKLTRNTDDKTMSTGTQESIQMLWNAMSYPTDYTMDKVPDAPQQVCKVWCEWDMGFANITDNESIFASRDDAVNELGDIDWSSVGYEKWEEVLDDGLLSLSMVDI